MKRLLQFGLLGAIASVLAGCPIWDDGHHAGTTGCFGDDCFQPQPDCTDSSQCGLNATCGEDQECHPGDCTFWGCASGECVVQPNGTATCDGDGSGGSGAAGSGGSGGTGGGSDVIWCGNPNDCSDGETCSPDGTCQAGACDAVGCIYGYTCDTAVTPAACTPTNPATCGADADCAAAGTGFKCVSGLCTQPSGLCFDQGQCDDGAKCADGKCIAGCNEASDCGGGYDCNIELGICSTPTDACTITNDCGGPDAVCVNGACVPRADLEDGSCEGGGVWSLNGCITDQSPTFTCTVDGVQDACASGSLCLHRSCYISCVAPNENVCTNLPTLNVCKGVTTVSGAHQVCGSEESLGGECDPQAALACPTAGAICLDGYCK
jgi:hypothetical protein